MRSQVLIHIRRFLVVTLALGVLGALLAATTAGAAKPRIVYTLPKATHARSMSLASDGAVWFRGIWGTEHDGGPGSFVGRWGPNRELTTFEVPEEVELGYPVAVGGDAWFPEVRYRDGQGFVGEGVEYSPTGVTRRTRLGEGVSYISAMTASGGNLWFAGMGRIGGKRRGVMGRVPLAEGGASQLLSLPRNCEVGALAAAQGTVWFGESCALERPTGIVFLRSNIGRVDPTGDFVRNPIRKGDEPISSAVGPDETIWFGIDRDSGYSKRSHVVRIAPGGEMARFVTPNSHLDSIAVGPEHRLWFQSSFGGQVFRALNSISPSGRFGKPICIDPRCDLEPNGLLADPRGGLLFSAGTANSAGGGGLAGILEAEAISNEAGVIGRLGP
jgi:hypothetical protein